MSPFRQAPVTAECLIICGALFLVCQLYSNADDHRFRDVQRQWGAVVTLSPVIHSDGPPSAIERQLHGPFDVWSGEWWRIPATAFHHANIFHLVLNCAAAWSLGSRLEQRWGSLRYALFLAPAILIPLLLEVIMGNSPVGFSGAVCAMLGAQIALQKYQPDKDDLPDEAIQLSLGLILAGIPASALGVIQFANAAHISGIVYGWITAWVFCGPQSSSVAIRWGYVALHALLIPAVGLAIHPINNGRRLWYMADRNPLVAPEQRLPMLQRAIEIDPSLTGIWLRLAEYRMIEGDIPGAWSLVIEGLSHNPSDPELFEVARRVWRRLPFGQDRETALKDLQRFFGDRAGVWSDQIRGLAVASRNSGKPRDGETLDPPLDPHDFPLDRPMELDWDPLPHQKSPRPAERQPPDAVEGTAL